ncbi:MAG: hypothetical protein SF028_09250 [Candidatus Sumerlaeia bacterium]|nr:hypothetical protein [Candidatus Sumerlaeia bacterium]
MKPMPPAAPPRRWSAHAATLFALAAMLLCAALAPAQTPLQGPFPADTPVEVGSPAERIRIVPGEGMFVEENVAYARGRTTIFYDDRRLIADRIILDLVTLEAQAYGDVLFVGEKEEVRADSARYNFRRNEGIAFGVDGRYDALYFKSVWDEEAKGPSMRRISENEALFRGSQFTTCDFPVPHYYITAKEVTLVPEHKVFFREMTLWVRGVPVLYLPFYSRGFEPSPWSFQFGYNTRLGAFARLGYRYVHRLRTPDWENPSVYRTRSTGTLDAFADYFSGAGEGAGITYRYRLANDRHLGYMRIYGLRDRVRDLSVDEFDADDTFREGEDRDDGGDRWVYRHRHNTMLGRTIFQADVDWLSDPDLYVDVLDRFEDFEEQRGRVIDRRVRFAGTYLREDWLARIMFDRRERVGRDRYTDFQEPYDDDRDLELRPVTRNRDDRGISSARYGVVREAYSGRVASNLVKLWNIPIYARLETNAFQALDSGFNSLDDADDTTVNGADLYGSLTNRIRLGERVTWTNTVGVGAGVYEREDERLVPRRLLRPTGTTTIDGQRFADEDTIFLGDGTKTLSSTDIEPGYLWADYRSRLNARFTDTLEGSLTYTFRQGTEDSLGEFYERAGRVEAAEDVYDFKTSRHWVEALLDYYLLYPNINVFLGGGYNLQSGDDITANERLYYANLGTNYRNDSKEFDVLSLVSYQTRQLRDRSDPNNFEQGTVGYTLQTQYVPLNGRWWTLLRLTAETKLDDDPLVSSNEDFDENRDKIRGDFIFGGKVGPKHILELQTAFDSELAGGWRRIGLLFRRDLHDAELALFGGVVNRQKENANVDDDRNESQPTELEVRGTLKFKLPSDGPESRRASLRTLQDARTGSLFVE